MKQNQEPCRKTKKVIDKGKRSKTLSIVKTDKNMQEVESAESSRDKYHAKGSPSLT